jgi:4-carboxymuconolactone decarboxylase
MLRKSLCHLCSVSNRVYTTAKKHPWITQQSSLSDDEMILTFLAGNTAAGNLNNLTIDWEHLSPSYQKLGIELVLQTHLNIGTPRVINALSTLRAYHEKNSETKWQDLCEGYSETNTGSNVMTTIYGENVYPKVVDKLKGLHPKLAQWTLDYAYGTVYNRGENILKLRELCTVSALAGLNVTPQLVSHIRGALRVGASREQVKQVIDNTTIIWDGEKYEQALAVWYTFERSRSGL